MLVVVVCVGLLGKLDKKAEKPDVAKPLQGKWQLSVQEHGGRKSTVKETLSISMEITGRKMVTRDGIDVKEDSEIEKIESKGIPASIDIKITAGPDIDKVVKGIWKQEGKTLTICVAEPGKERPKEFAGKEGTGHTLLVFTRVGK